MRTAGLFLLAPVLYAQAQVTVFLPGFDEQPLIADVAGTDGKGRTTYFVHNTETDPNVPAEGFFGTATVVQGPTDASIHFEVGQITIDSSCTWTAENIEQATCTGVNPAGETAVETAPLPLLTVQLGTTVGAPGPSPTQPSSSGFVVDSTALTKPSASRPLTSGPSNSGSLATGSNGSSAAAEPTGDAGSASRHAAPGALLLSSLVLMHLV